MVEMGIRMWRKIFVTCCNVSGFLWPEDQKTLADLRSRGLCSCIVDVFVGDDGF